MSILKRKYDEEVPDSAKYVMPQASMPARRTQVKLLPDGKTSFTQNEIIRIMIPPQGYFDPEFSYLSFNVELTAPESYKLKALEVWNRDSHAFIYDIRMDQIVAIGRPGQITFAYKGANGDAVSKSGEAVPFIRHVQEISNVATDVLKFDSDLLVEWVPCGQIYPVLPYSSHGFFTRVVLRTSNNTPIEDIQEYDYLSAHLGSLLQSEGYTDTMGALLEGWGDIETRAKMGLACVKNLKYIEPKFKHPYMLSSSYATSISNKTSAVNGAIITATNTSVSPPLNGPYWYVNKDMVYTDYSAACKTDEISGLSPEGVTKSDFREQVKGMKFTCNLNLGLFQQSQNLPLLFSGGMILELYTAPFERCMSFTSIYSSADPVDFPNLYGCVEGDGHLIDITAMGLRLPPTLTSCLGLPTEGTADESGSFPNVENCGYANSLVCADDQGALPLDTKRYLQPGYSEPKAANPYQQTLYKAAATGAVAANFGVNAHLSESLNNVKVLRDRTRYFTEGWSYSLTNVELRADMVQFSQSYDESVAEIVDSDEGLPITFQTFSTQKVTYGGKRSTLTVNERARSIQFALAVFKDSQLERMTHSVLIDNDTRFICLNDEKPYILGSADSPANPAGSPKTYVPTVGAANVPNQMSIYFDSGEKGAGRKFTQFSSHQKYVTIANPWVPIARLIPNDIQQQALYPNLIDYQFRVGTRFIPASPVDCSYGAVQAYIELMKAIGMYGSFSGTGQRAMMPGNRITPDLYAKRICTAASRTLAGAYYSVKKNSADLDQAVRNIEVGQLQSNDYVGQRYRIPQRFILGMNFSDIPDHASGVDTATQALSIELALNGDSKETTDATEYNCYMFLNVRRDMFVRCGGQIEILY